MENNEGQDITILPNERKTRKSFFSSDDNVKPILAYFIFTTKYILKKKSTILLPLISFVVVLIATMTPMFFLEEASSPNQKEAFFSVFIPMISSISIALSVIFSTTKALNLFKDISNEGMEILIVSKPIKRSQIIFVRFIYFLFLGILLSLINYFATLIGLFATIKMLPTNFSIFNYITIYFFAMMMAYILFGSISIILSLKFSTKLVSSLSLGIFGAGLIFSQIIPQVIPIVEQGFEVKINEFNSTASPTNPRINLRYYETTDGKIIIYTKNIQTPLTEREKNIISNAFNAKDDLSWVINLNNFVNPVAGISKISSVKPTLFNDERNNNVINFSDFNISLVDGPVKNNFINDRNYFLNIANIMSTIIEFELSITLQGSEIPENRKVLFDLFQIRSILSKNVNADALLNVFDNLLKTNLVNNVESVNTIVNKSEALLKTSFDLIIQKITDPQTPTILQTSENNPQPVRVFDEQDFKNKMTIFFFYLYGLEKLNGNIDNFKNKQIFIDSAKPDATINNFLGFDFSKSYYDIDATMFANKPLFFNRPSTELFETFVSSGEKVSSEIIATTWSIIILLVLAGTIIIYYRKDFT